MSILLTAASGSRRHESQRRAVGQVADRVRVAALIVLSDRMPPPCRPATAWAAAANLFVTCVGVPPSIDTIHRDCTPPDADDEDDRAIVVCHAGPACLPAEQLHGATPIGDLPEPLALRIGRSEYHRPAVGGRGRNDSLGDHLLRCSAILADARNRSVAANRAREQQPIRRPRHVVRCPARLRRGHDFLRVRSRSIAHPDGDAAVGLRRHEAVARRGDAHVHVAAEIVGQTGDCAARVREAPQLGGPAVLPRSDPAPGNRRRANRGRYTWP